MALCEHAGNMASHFGHFISDFGLPSEGPTVSNYIGQVRAVQCLTQT